MASVDAPPPSLVPLQVLLLPAQPRPALYVLTCPSPAERNPRKSSNLNIIRTLEFIPLLRDQLEHTCAPLEPSAPPNRRGGCSSSFSNLPPCLLLLCVTLLLFETDVVTAAFFSPSRRPCARPTRRVGILCEQQQQQRNHKREAKTTVRTAEH